MDCSTCFSISWKGKPVEIVNRTPTDFPAVMGDENRVRQIVYNFVHNAVKFTTNGEIIIQASNQGGAGASLMEKI